MWQASRQRLLGLAGVAGILAVGAFAADAAGDARVSFNSGTLTVSVAPTEPGNHIFTVEPFKEQGGRDGWRARTPLSDLGEPALVTFDSDCFGNSFLNDVVCTGQRNAVTITTSAGNEDVTVLDFCCGGLVSCIPGESFAKVATVNLGGGNDKLLGAHKGCDLGQITEFGFPFHFVADGGPGNDTLMSTANPVFRAGPDNLKGGSGRDTLQGASGDDTLDGGADADVLSGAGGFDTVSYSGRDVGVTVQLDGLANDGSPADGPGGQRDNVSSDVERILGGSGKDLLLGFPGEQRLLGNGDDDTVGGGGDNDEVFGGAGNDDVFGQGGLDFMSGGSGNDSLQAQQDGLEDTVDCGPDTDTAILDLQDTLTRVKGELFRTGGCETITRNAVDDGPPGIALKQRLRPRSDGKVVVRVACPRRARTACRGRLTLRRVNGRRVLARGRYRVRLGNKASVALTARARLPRRVVAAMREQGVSKKGPRSSSRVLRVVRRR